MINFLLVEEVKGGGGGGGGEQKGEQEGLVPMLTARYVNFSGARSKLFVETVLKLLIINPLVFNQILICLLSTSLGKWW